MSNDDARALIDRYRRMAGKGTPSEYMAYMWARKQVGEPMSAGQRGFLEAAAKQPAPAHD